MSAKIGIKQHMSHFLKSCYLFEKKMENTCRVVVTFMPHVKHFLWKKKKRDCRQDDGRCVTSLTKLEPQCYLTANDGQACWTDCEARRAGGQILNTLFISFCPCDRQADSFHMREPAAPFGEPVA
jgi:hypothetical protein